MKFIHILVFLFILTPLFFGPLSYVSAIEPDLGVPPADPNGPRGGTEPRTEPGGGTEPRTGAGGGTLGVIELINPLEADSIPELFEEILKVIMVFAVPIIVFFIIYAGFLYVTAGGNTETIKKAHYAITFALIGGLLILGALVLVTVIRGTVEAVSRSN